MKNGCCPPPPAVAPYLNIFRVYSCTKLVAFSERLSNILQHNHSTVDRLYKQIASDQIMQDFGSGLTEITINYMSVIFVHYIINGKCSVFLLGGIKDMLQSIFKQALHTLLQIRTFDFSECTHLVILFNYLIYILKNP